MSTDRIERKVLLHAPRGRVWRAITDTSEFGSWFGMKLVGGFTSGQLIRGTICPTTVNAEVAEMQKAYEGTVVELNVVQVEPETLFSFRWHPYAVDLNKDYSNEPTTLVTFTLEDAQDGTLLTIVESGFDEIPLERRAQAFKSNEGGWTWQLKLIEAYLAKYSK